MANRHGHKKLRSAARARMLSTGESYQKALTHIREANPHGRAAAMLPVSSVDLVSVCCFGWPAALATFEIAGRISVLLLLGPHRSDLRPRNPFLALGSPRTLN
jgi:hypothetical protein